MNINFNPTIWICNCFSCKSNILLYLRWLKLFTLVSKYYNYIVNSVLKTFLVLKNLVCNVWGILILTHIFYSGYIVVSDFNLIYIGLFILYIFSMLSLVYLLFVNTKLVDIYPKLYISLLVICCSIIILGFLYFSIQICLDLCSLLYRLNRGWVEIRQGLRSSSKGFNPNPNPNNNNNNSNENKPQPKKPNSSSMTPDERKKRKYEINKAYRQRNKEKLREREKEYRERNKEKVSNSRKITKSKKPDLYKEINQRAFKKWSDQNRDTISNNNKHWREKNPDVVKANNDKFGAIKRETTRLNKEDMAQYEGIDKNNFPLFEQWKSLSAEELQDLFKKKRIRHDLRAGFEFYLNNPDYYKDLDLNDV